MARNVLFRQLCSPETMLAAWHLAQGDSRNDFVLDPVGYIDFASNLKERLRHLVEEVKAHRYRPRHLLDIDLPKSGLSVRPGNVLPIEEAILLHAITYLLAPLLDNRLDKAVYSYRLHPEWRDRVKKGASLFRENKVEFPFLRRATIRSISPFDSWYERWPEFQRAVGEACTEEGYTHLTKTDITAYFENIDLRLLETQIRSLLKREEDIIVQLLFRILDGWTRLTSTGTPVGRGIPQGNEVSSFLGNIYLIPLDRELLKFCRLHDAKWFRYVDDVKVFTRSTEDALQAVFVINDVLRTLYLNLQGSKTDVLSGKRLVEELNNDEMDATESVFQKIQRFDPDKRTDSLKITTHLQALTPYISRFRRNPRKVTQNLKPKQSQLLRRLMTVYGYCARPHLRKTALMALHDLPELRVLEKSLTYLSQLHFATHGVTIDEFFEMLEAKQLPFPYQIGSVLETISILHPRNPRDIASRARRYGLTNKMHWFVTQKALEVISAYPYKPDYAQRLANAYLADNHPLVRRAACVLLLRSPKVHVRKRLKSLIYDPDPSLSRLALYFLRLLQDSVFAQRELSRIKQGSESDLAKQRTLPCLYVMAASEDKAIATSVYDYLNRTFRTRSEKLNWHRNTLLRGLNWTQKVN